MKKLVFLALLLTWQAAQAQPTVLRNDSAATTICPNDLEPCSLATSAGGALITAASISGTSSAANPFKLEDGVAANADAGVPTFFVRQATPASTCGADTDYCSVAGNQLGSLWVQPVPGTTTGGSISRRISLATNNSTNVKSSAGLLLDVTACNINAAVRYVKLYNLAAAPTCGTDTPSLVLPVGPNACQTISSSFGIPFNTGIGFCIVTGATDADNTATAANEQFLTISYR